MQSVLKFVWKMIYKFYYSDCSESAVRLCFAQRLQEHANHSHHLLYLKYDKL